MATTEQTSSTKTCPECRRDVALTPSGLYFEPHLDREPRREAIGVAVDGAFDIPPGTVPNTNLSIANGFLYRDTPGSRCRHSGASALIGEFEITEIGERHYVYRGLPLYIETKRYETGADFTARCERCNSEWRAYVAHDELRRIYQAIPADPSPRTLAAKLEGPRRAIDEAAAWHVCLPPGHATIPGDVLRTVDPASSRWEQLEALATAFGDLARQALLDEKTARNA